MTTKCISRSRWLLYAFVAGVFLPPITAARAQPHWLAGTMSEAGPHPRSLLLPADRDRVVARLSREPYRTVFHRVFTKAMQEHDPADDTPRTAYHRANTARSAALLFYVDRTLDASGAPAPFPDENTRRQMGEKAVAHLLSMPTESYAKGLIDSVLDIYTAHELHLWADTLDLLLGADLDVLGPARSQAIQSLADLAADFYADYNLTNWLFLRSEVNNHRSKSAAALGIAAIVLNGESFAEPSDDGRYDPARWLDFAIRFSDLVQRDLLTDTDGGNQEGGHYLLFAMVNHLPFCWAWHHYTDGATYEVLWDEPVSPFYRFHTTGTYVVPDLWRSPWLARQVTWAVRTQLPDGSFPPFDDCIPGDRFIFGAFVQEGFAEAPVYRWAWERAGQTTSGAVDPAPLILVTYDDTIPSTSPGAAGWPLYDALPYAGQVIFRSGWGTQDVLALLLCEHGTAAGWVQTRWGDYVDGSAGHEHPDGGSFMLYAYGESLALDSGYLGWDERYRVNRPENHNVLLVDGHGAQRYRATVPSFEFNEEREIVLLEPEQEGGYAPPLDGMAYLVHADLDVSRVGFAEIVTHYSEHVTETEIRRRATFLADRFLVLHDTASPMFPGDTHAFTVQIHGNGGGTSGGTFARTTDGATWTRSGARLLARVVSDVGVDYGERLAEHEQIPWQASTHTVLEATAMGPQARFLSLLAPEPVPTADATVIWLSTGDCSGPCLKWRSTGLTCFAWFGFLHEVRGRETGPLLLTAEQGAYCLGPNGVHGSFAGLEGDSEALLTTHMALDATGTPLDWTARVHAHAPDRQAATVTLPWIDGQRVWGACEVVAQGERWQVTTPVPAELTTVDNATTVPAHYAHLRLIAVPPGSPPALPLGTAVQLDASASCPATNRRFRWQLLTQPELSVASLPTAETAEDTVSFVPDLPGVYRVGLTVGWGPQTAQANLSFEVEGELAWADPPDAGVPDAGDSTNITQKRGCSCIAQGASDAGLTTLWFIWLPLLICFLLARRRRRARVQPSHPVKP